MIKTVQRTSPTFEHWTELQNLDEILARSRARYKNSGRSKSLPARKITSQNNKSRYVRNRGPKMAPGKMDPELKHAAQNHVVRPTLSIRDNDLGPYIEREIPATDDYAEYESPERRKPQPGEFGPDLHYITLRDSVSQNATPIPTLEHGLLSPTTDEDFHQPSQSQIRQSHELGSILGIDNDIRPSKSAEYPQPDTAREASGDWELFDFELDEPNIQDTTGIAFLGLEGSSISNIADSSEMSRDIPRILRAGTPLPIESLGDKPMSRAHRVEEAAPFSLTKSPPNEVFSPFHDPPQILWSQSPRQPSKLRGYIANMRQRHSTHHRTYKKPVSKPSLVLEYPKQITLTIPTLTSSPVESSSQFVDQGLLMPPPRLYKKKQRQQQLIADSINVRELRVKRLSHMGISDEEFAARRDSIMHEFTVVYGD